MKKVIYTTLSILFLGLNMFAAGSVERSSKLSNKKTSISKKVSKQAKQLDKAKDIKIVQPNEEITNTPEDNIGDHPMKFGL